MKKLILLLSLALCMAIMPADVSAELVEGVWDSSGPALPGGDLLKKGISTLDLSGTYPEYAGSTLMIVSDESVPGTQWSIQGTRVGGVMGSAWWEGTPGAVGSHYFMEFTGFYEGTGTFLFDGKSYTVTGYGIQDTYTVESIYQGGDVSDPDNYAYVRMVGNGRAGGIGFIAPNFRIDVYGTYQETAFSGNHHEGYFDYIRMSITEMPIVNTDTDGDGVIDSLDKCPATPASSCVDNQGCRCDCSALYDINGDDKTGLEEAIHILQLVAGVRAGDSFALAGFWRRSAMESVAGGQSARAERGEMTISPDGSFSDSYVDSDGNTGSVSAGIQMDPEGAITVPGDPTLEGRLDTAHHVMAFTNTHEDGIRGTVAHFALSLRMTSAYAQPDLAGDWEMFTLASAPGAPYWKRGPVTIASDGSFVTGVMERYGLASVSGETGTLSLSRSGGIFSNEIGPAFFGFLGKNKTIFAGTNTWSDTTPITPELVVFVKKAAAYSQTDVAGHWRMQAIVTGTAAPLFIRGDFNTQPDGSFSALMTPGNGLPPQSLSGNITITSDGIVSSDATPSFRGCLDAGKTVMVATDVLAIPAPASTMLMVFLKQ